MIIVFGSHRRGVYSGVFRILLQCLKTSYQPTYDAELAEILTIIIILHGFSTEEMEYGVVVSAWDNCKQQRKQVSMGIPEEYYCRVPWLEPRATGFCCLQ